MASSRTPRSGGGRLPKVITIIGVIIALILASVVIVSDGGSAWNRFASAANETLSDFGLSLNQVSGSDSLKAGADDQQSLGLQITVPKADPDIGTGSDTSDDTADGDAADSTQSETNTTTGLPNGAYGPYTSQQALDALASIQTATPHTSGYDRETQFGTWANSSSLCGTGTTRDQILARDMANVTMNSNCKVQTGDLQDPYTGTSIHFTYGRDTSSEIQIDHVVSVYDAYASGLWKADQSTRVSYYNDPDVLVASQGDANNIKSEGINLKTQGASSKRWKQSTPSVWLPDNTSYQCAYMSKRVYVKTKYSLSMSGWEKKETKSFLQSCVAAGI